MYNQVEGRVMNEEFEKPDDLVGFRPPRLKTSEISGKINIGQTYKQER